MCYTKKNKTMGDRKTQNTSHFVATYSMCDFICTMETLPPTHRAIVNNTWEALGKAPSTMPGIGQTLNECGSTSPQSPLLHTITQV